MNDESITSSPVEFTGSWTKGMGGTLAKKSGIADISSDNWNININYGKVDETCWGNPVATKKLIQAVKAQGFNTIRRRYRRSGKMA